MINRTYLFTKASIIMKKIRFIFLSVALTACSYMYAQEFSTFVEGSYTFGTGKWAENRLNTKMGVGCLLNPNGSIDAFLGVGVGLSYYESSKIYGLPIFGNARVYFLNNNSVSPYADLKIGYSVLDAEGLYISPSIGCRIKDFYIGVSYDMLDYKMTEMPVPVNVEGFAVNLGIIF